MKRIVLASGNKGKLKEFREILNNCEILSPVDLGLDFDVEENGTTFFDNALIKAKALYELCGLPTLADDSGLCVDALNGEPGIFSARYGGENESGMDKLLRVLDGEKNRKAHFHCCVVYYDGNNVVSADGEVWGSITTEKHGSGGFGYDPVFLSDELGITFGEASAEAKNAISHRARAVAALKQKLDF